MCYPAIVIDSTIFILKYMIFTKSLPCSLITQNPKPAKGLAVLQRSLSSALQIKYAVTASHSGDFLSPKLSGIVKCKAYAKGAISPSLEGRRTASSSSEMPWSAWVEALESGDATHA